MREKHLRERNTLEREKHLRERNTLDREKHLRERSGEIDWELEGERQSLLMTMEESVVMEGSGGGTVMNVPHVVGAKLDTGDMEVCTARVAVIL